MKTLFVMHNREKGLILTKNGEVIKTFIHLGGFKLDFKNKLLNSERQFDNFVNDLVDKRTLRN